MLTSVTLMIFVDLDSSLHDPEMGSHLEEESSISDPSVASSDEEEAPYTLQYHLVNNGTKRGGRKLVDTDGYTYNVKRQRANATDWQCTVRPKGNPCKATVVQKSGGLFQAGKQGHNHQANVGSATAATITAAVKERALADLFKPAPAIVNEVCMNYIVKTCKASPFSHRTY